jgi:hypothetical protein
MPSRLEIDETEALGVTKPPIKWVSGSFGWGYSDRGLKPTTDLHLVPR